jgi:hypothetical protein
LIGVSRGSWYFEAKITDLPEGGAARIGFGQAHANLQGPLGYDKFGYSWRSRYGTVFHQARGKTFCKGGYGLNDVIGFLIDLPEDSNAVPLVPESCKDRVRLRDAVLYYHYHSLKKEIDFSFSLFCSLLYVLNLICTTKTRTLYLKWRKKVKSTYHFTQDPKLLDTKMVSYREPRSRIYTQAFTIQQCLCTKM